MRLPFPVLTAQDAAATIKADLRGKDERERAQLIINHCAHPDYRDELQSFVNTAKEGYSPESLANTVAMHVQFLKTGDMRGTQWN